MSQIRNRGNEIPELFSELLVPVSSVHSYNTRYASQDNHYRPAARTNYGKFSFKFFASQLWETILGIAAKISNLQGGSASRLV